MPDYGSIAVEAAKRWGKNKSGVPNELWRSVCQEYKLTESEIKKAAPKTLLSVYVKRGRL